MQRMRTIAGHFVAPAVGANISTLHPNDVSALASAALSGPDDVVIVSAKRTPICKARRGSFKDTVPDALLEAVITRVLKETGIDPKYIGDIAVGNVLAEGSGAAMARMAQFRCGLPETVPLHGVNRMCSSGLQAVMNIAAGIKAGLYDAGLGCGMESMSVYKQGSDTNINPKSFEFDKARDCMIPMGITSENVAEQYGITREMQDKMGYESQTKAKRARDLGNFKEEIVPVTTTVLDKDGDSHEVTVSQDEGIRDTTMAGLTKLRPAFKKDGTTTAGNSSQVSDGAAAVLLMKRSLAERLRLPVLGRIISYAVAGVPPRVMGIGPAEAIPKALEKAGLTINDIDVFEINEAFASQATYCVQKLGIPMEKVNPNGGAIALGHPLGCTGARQVPTLLYELKRRRKRAFGVISMCIGTGMGAAAVLEYPGTV
ncbi:3-ketoacyl-CoA thiolase B, peroxisomal-like [Saccoglossus kowalevskii]|uniref:3-ketoacyl-CoA thiolase A, peroxisomal-like n=1 Tax=Saccoglossus kowalevskii TaxID=10224 RepID=A0ABM0H1K2_SACKO|nr:PREDICTED: 3-ketoacyl-CoA thiolase A, peroxisomal-like [Saccoglossus kowalevskii]